jgi:hypothetical protein
MPPPCVACALAKFRKGYFSSLDRACGAIEGLGKSLLPVHQPQHYYFNLF